MTTTEGNHSDTLQAISPEQLKEKIEAHALWLKSGGREGAQCSLRRTNLKGFDLSNALLAEAILTGADLSEANLTNAQLQRADLSYANLENVRSLMPDQLAGANLRDTGLPEQISKFDGLAQVVELSKMGNRSEDECRPVHNRSIGALATAKTRLSGRLGGLWPHICFPGHAGRTPLPDTEGNDAGQSCRNTGRAVDHNFSIDQFSGISTALQVLVGLNVMKIRVWHHEGNQRNREHGDGRVVDALRA